jgi:hypothetical protein
MERVYRVRLQLAVVQNGLEIIQSMMRMAQAERITPGKSKYQEPFRNLLFAFIIRMDRLLDEMAFNTRTVYNQALEGKKTAISASCAEAWLTFFSEKRRLILDAQGLLEKHRTIAAIQKMDEARVGIKEFSSKVDDLFLGRGQRSLLRQNSLRPRAGG